jgi:putative flippase GtrA
LAAARAVNRRAQVVTSSIRALLKRGSNLWAARSLVIGTFVGVIDLSLGSFLALVVHVPTRVAAMTALTVSSTITFLLNRRFAFHAEDLAGPAVKWVIVCIGEIIVHGQIVTSLRDAAHLPYPLAKISADLIIFTVPHLLLLRYVVFPRGGIAARS